MFNFRRSLVIITCVFALIIGTLQWSKYQHFGYNGLDLGIYSQTAWSLANGHGFANSIHDPTYLADHLELGLIPLAAIYRFAPSPLTLLWFQTLAIALAGLLIGRLARRRFSDNISLLIAGVFLAHPLIYNAAMYEFHGLALALPLIVGSIIAFERKRWARWLVLIVLTALCREDLPLLALGWAILAAIKKVPWRWWVSAAGFGLIWFAAAHYIIAAANLAGSYKYFAFVSWLGSTPLEMLRFPFMHPVIFLTHIIAPNNWAVALGLLIGFGFLPILRPARLIPLSFIFAQELILGGGASSVLRLHYVIPYLPFLAWATIVVIDDARRKMIWPHADRFIVMAVLTVLAVIGPLYLQLAYGWAELPWKNSGRNDYASPTAIRSALGQIRPGDAVLTTFPTLPNLANRSSVYSLNYVYLGRRQYSETPYVVTGPIDAALIDWQQFYDYQFLYRETMFEGQTGEQRVAALLKKNGLVPAWQRGSLVVYRRAGSISIQPTTALSASSVVDNKFSLLSTSAVNESGQVKITMRWHPAYTPGTPLSIRFTWTDRDGREHFTMRLLGEGFMPATTWSSDHDWQTVYYLDIGASKPATVRIEWLKLTGRYRLNRWRTFRPIIDQIEPLGNSAVAVVN